MVRQFFFFFEQLGWCPKQTAYSAYRERQYWISVYRSENDSMTVFQQSYCVFSVWKIRTSDKGGVSIWQSMAVVIPLPGVSQLVCCGKLSKPYVLIIFHYYYFKSVLLVFFMSV